MKTCNIAILFGGCSSEYGVSLISAGAVIRNLDRDKYQPVLVGISRDGRWFRYSGSVEKIEADAWENEADCVPAMLSPNRGGGKLLVLEREGPCFVSLDAIFPVLHGRNGEDGTVQGLAELAGIPLVGCGLLASALCMDKDRAHRLVGAAGVRVPRGLTLGRTASPQAAGEFAAQVGYPLYVKPVKAGSSYGVTKVNRAEELERAIALAFQYDDQVILEENIPGFEVGCAVLGREELTVGEVDEIELSGGFFDFTEKYTLKTSAIHVPARVDQAKAEEIKETAKVIYRVLGCSGFARVDLFLTPEGEIVFNEVNTIPGFTEHSRYPGMMKAAGLSFPALLDRIITLAVEA